MSTLQHEVDAMLEALIAAQRRGGRERLPPERELSARWGVSRVTLAKVIQDRVSRGILERRRGSGTYILQMNESGRTLCLGVLLRRRYARNDAHFMHLIDGIARHADSHNCDLQIFDGIEELLERDPRQNRLFRAIDAGMVDGLLVISRMSAAMLGDLRARVPMVIVHNTGGTESLPAVIPDWSASGFLATQHLLQRGHRRIAYVAHHFDQQLVVFEQSGYRLAFRAAGLPEPDPSLLCQTRGVDSSFDADHVRHFLETVRPTALYVHDDRLAAVMIAAAAEIGLEIPRDLSLVGYGHFTRDLPLLQRLTTIDPDWSAIGRRSIELLSGMIAGEAVESTITVISPSLIEGDTVAPPSPRPQAQP